MTHNYRTEYSQIEGSLAERMTEFVVLLFGECLSDRDGGFTLRTRVEVGATMEFGMRAKVTFPNPRAVVLKCGRLIAEIQP